MEPLLAVLTYIYIQLIDAVVGGFWIASYIAGVLKPRPLSVALIQFSGQTFRQSK